MADQVFISYSRKNQEFARRLASDLNARLGSVWFDQSDIPPGETWRQAIEKGIRGCKVFILVVSPDSIRSKEVRWELDLAREAGKRIIPVIYTTTKMPADLDEMLHKIQHIDLRKGVYSDNFELLIDGLAAGGVKTREPARERTFLREQATVKPGGVVSRLSGWGCAWGIGWGLALLIVTIVLAAISTIQNGQFTSSESELIIFLTIAGMIGGGIGGLLAGGVTMGVLRHVVPSISWKHMKPSIGIWAVSGPLGVLASVGITALLVKIGVIATQSTEVDCSGLSASDCFWQGMGASLSDVINQMVAFCLFSLLFMLGIWFVTGLLAGRWAVRRIRALEPQITDAQSRKASIGWAFGAVLALIGTIAALALVITVTGG